MGQAVDGVGDVVVLVGIADGPGRQGMDLAERQPEILFADRTDDVGAAARCEFGNPAKRPRVLVHVDRKGFLAENPVDLGIGFADRDVFPEIQRFLVLQTERGDVLQKFLILELSQLAPVNFRTVCLRGKQAKGANGREYIGEFHLKPPNIRR